MHLYQNLKLYVEGSIVYTQNPLDNMQEFAIIKEKPKWRNWRNARHLKCRTLETLRVRIPPSALLNDSYFYRKVDNE